MQQFVSKLRQLVETRQSPAWLMFFERGLWNYGKA